MIYKISISKKYSPNEAQKSQKELRSTKQPVSLENVGPNIHGMNMALFSKASCSPSLVPTFLLPLLHPFFLLCLRSALSMLFACGESVWLSTTVELQF